MVIAVDKSHYRLIWKELTVRVIFQDGPWAQEQDVQDIGWHPLPNIHQHFIDVINEYVRQHSLGRRWAYDQWRLNSESARTAFLLKF